MNLINRLMEKEECALEELMKLYGDYLFRTAFLLLKDEQAAEEAVQDTFVTAFEKISQLEEADKLKSWLTSIVINRCRSTIRKWSWKSILLNFEKVEQVVWDESIDEPMKWLLELERNQSLSDALQQLDYKYREVLILFYYNDLKINEIADYTKTNLSTVKTRLTRGRLLLKDILVKGELDGDKGKRNIQESARF